MEEINKILGELKMCVSKLEAALSSEEKPEVEEEKAEGEPSEDTMMKKKLLMKSMME